MHLDPPWNRGSLKNNIIFFPEFTALHTDLPKDYFHNLLSSLTLVVALRILWITCLLLHSIPCRRVGMKLNQNFPIGFLLLLTGVVDEGHLFALFHLPNLWSIWSPRISVGLLHSFLQRFLVLTIMLITLPCYWYPDLGQR